MFMLDVVIRQSRKGVLIMGTGQLNVWDVESGGERLLFIPEFMKPEIEKILNDEIQKVGPDFLYFLDEELRSALEPTEVRTRIVISPNSGRFWTLVMYVFDKEKEAEVSDEVAVALRNWVQGQWSDGIGEGFEQRSFLTSYGDEFSYSMWHPGQEVAIVMV